jgi:ornithine cyclodeaminase/alanine dehydrogenase-like protein (mu-crystallin family)
MLVLSGEQIHALAPMPRLIARLEDQFRAGCVVPPRQVTAMPGGAGERLFLTMPAFASEGGTAVKLATFFPDNPARGLPTIQAAIVLFSPTGTPMAILDGTTVTRLRTGAASALASKYLSRDDSSQLVIIGTGALAPAMAAAHCAIRPITRVSVWGRRPNRAAATAGSIRSLVGDHVEVVVTAALDQAVATADIVSCATSSATPVLAGRWLRPGAFVDLVGSFSPTRREADDEVVLRSRIFVDTLEGALAEAGDLLDPLGRGIIERSRIEGELGDLVCGRAQGRVSEDEIITFKSVGTALEDLAAARLVVESARSGT